MTVYWLKRLVQRRILTTFNQNITQPISYLFPQQIPLQLQAHTPHQLQLGATTFQASLLHFIAKLNRKMPSIWENKHSFCFICIGAGRWIADFLSGHFANCYQCRLSDRLIGATLQRFAGWQIANRFILAPKNNTPRPRAASPCASATGWQVPAEHFNQSSRRRRRRWRWGDVFICLANHLTAAQSGCLGREKRGDVASGEISSKWVWFWFMQLQLQLQL